MKKEKIHLQRVIYRGVELEEQEIQEENWCSEGIFGALRDFWCSEGFFFWCSEGRFGALRHVLVL